MYSSVKAPWRMPFATFKFIAAVLALVLGAPSVVLAEQGVLSYETLQEPEMPALDLDSRRTQYEATRKDEALEALVKQLIRARKSDDAWTLIEAHGVTLSKAYFEANLATVNARIAEVGRLSKLVWARRLNAACSSRVEIAPRDETALECLAKFHARAPAIAGGDEAIGKKALDELTGFNPARGHLVQAEIIFSKDADAARALVDTALSFEDVYDEGLMQAAMVYGYFKDWDAVRAALGRVAPGSDNAQMRHYQVGKLSAELGEQLGWGETSLLTFLRGDTLYYGVDFRGPAHWRIGQIFQHGGRLALAQRAFERALDYNPKLSGAKKDLKAIKKQRKQGR